MLRDMLITARAGQPLWLPDVRASFAAEADGAPLMLRLRSFDGKTRTWEHRLPRWHDGEERALVRDYLCATIYNTLSTCGGDALYLYADTADADVSALLAELPELFQMDAPRRCGLGKVVSIAERMSRAFGGDGFAFRVCALREFVPVSPEPERMPGGLAPRLRALCDAAAGKNLVGIDVGGTDIKLAASKQGRLVAVKEYDWNPALFTTAEEIAAPILLLARLMRACIASDGTDEMLARALRKDASEAEMEAAVAAAEEKLDVGVLDAVGLSFPDIVLHDRIVGGETPKTDGIRRNRAVDYKTEFAGLSALRERLLPLCRGAGRCRIVNDGNIAAFTAAMELACGGADARIAHGVFAHSLGTDLGTGWLDARGAIPQMPLELYDLWLDLGSAPSAALPPADLRSTRNENSGLPGARRYMGQAAAYRMAYELDPRLLDGFTEEKNGVLRIRTAPEDLRKPCLEHLMRCAGDGNAAAQEVFRRIGENLAVVSREAEYLLRTGTDARFLFGRFVKSERCFELLCEGFSRGGAGNVTLENGGGDLAETPLMRQLAQREDVTVAQFAQAVGGFYFALTEEETV